jgi:hypothetical protein
VAALRAVSIRSDLALPGCRSLDQIGSGNARREKKRRIATAGPQTFSPLERALQRAPSGGRLGLSGPAHHRQVASLASRFDRPGSPRQSRLEAPPPAARLDARNARLGLAILSGPAHRPGSFASQRAEPARCPRSASTRSPQDGARLGSGVGRSLPRSFVTC